MNISYTWLKDYLDFQLTPEETGDILTNVGLEVEAIRKYESVKGGFEGLKIGLVKSVEKHPDADKLTVTKVNLGDSADLQIICGALNVAAGQKVVVATDGVLLHPFAGEPFKIKKTKIRGIASEGMICAEDEIGLSEDHGGIIVLPENAPVGTWFKDFQKVISDHIIEIGLTPNRGDAMSHIGVARDLGAYLKCNTGQSASVTIPSIADFKVVDVSYPIEVIVENTEACPRYSGVTISGITVVPSPDWIQQKLKAIGLRPINNIVDITNYVMLECGQPLHAFDADEISGQKITVKTLPEDTPFRTLDDKEIKLRKNDLMICDAEKGMCIAGVYGGVGSGVKETTKTIFLESACFNAKYIRRTSTYHQLRTEAATRFEKETDPNNTIYALKRASILISEICGGKISSEIVDVYPKPVEEKVVSLTWEKLDRIAGIVIAHDKAEEILRSLSFRLLSADDKQLTVSVPTFKSDVGRSEDLIEEVLRIYGYDKIVIPEAVRSSINEGIDDKKEVLHEEISQMLASAGFHEMINNSISNSRYGEEFFPETKESIVRLLSYSNAGLDSLRTSMLFPALEVVSYNHNRKEMDLKLFEFGKTYSKANGSYTESSCLTLLTSGSLHQESWKDGHPPADVYYLKGVVNNVLSKSGIRKYSASPVSNTVWPNGMTYSAGPQQLVSFGKLDQKILNAFDIRKEVFYAEFDADVLLKLSKRSIKFSALPKFPSVRRDLALVIDHGVSFGQIEELADKTAGNLLSEVNLFDIYEDEKLGAGKKSYAVSFLFLDENKTLTDEEVDKMMNMLVQQFETRLNAHIRK